MNKRLYCSPLGHFRFSINLLVALALVLSVFAALPSDQAGAATVLLAGWPDQTWTASSGSSSNYGVALLSTNTTNPFATSTGTPPGEQNVFVGYNWANGSGSKYWKVRVISTGYQNLTVSSQQMSTSLGFINWNGPRDFKLQYSLNDSSWTDVTNGTLTLGGSYIASGKLANLSLPAAVNNQPNVYLRWIMTSNTSVSPAYPTTDSDAQSYIGGIYIHGDQIPTGPSITTSAITGSPFYVSAAQGASVSVPYALAGVFTAGNIFTAYLSDATGNFASETAIGSRTATDAGTISATIPAGKASGSGYRIRVKSNSPVVTGSANGSNLSIILDTTAPVVTVPSSLNVEATGPSGAAYTFTATAADTAPVQPEVTCTPASGSVFPLGATTVTCNAKDTAGNTGSSAFTVTVQDTTPPVVTVPSNATIEATGPTGADHTFTATASDLVAPLNPTAACTPASGSSFPFGATTVTCAATDTAGNTASSTFTITVRDTTAPAITVPSDATIEATAPSGAAFSFVASAVELVAPLNPTVICAPASGSTFPLGATTVTCFAVDTAGNAASKTFTVNVQDKTAPDITVPANTTLEAAGPAGAVHTFSASATDLVDPVNPTVTCAPASGSTFPLGETTVTCSAADKAGNDSSSTFTVTVQDTTPPVVTVPSNVVLEATGPAGVTHTFTATAIDLVAPANLTVTCAPASGSTFLVGVTTVACSATDTAGNTGANTFTVTVWMKTWYYLPTIFR